ncbi:MAG: family 16 glycoside hydrolase [Pirellulaceae bacterium]
MRIRRLSVLATGLVCSFILAGIANADDAALRRDVLDGIEMIEQESGHTWVVTQRSEGRFPAANNGESRGQWQRDGYVRLDGGPLAIIRKDDKIAVQVDDMWMTVEQAKQRTRSGRRRQTTTYDELLSQSELPTVLLRDYLNRATGFRRDGDVISATLSVADAATLFFPPDATGPGAAGNQGNGSGRAPLRDASGTVTVELADKAVVSISVQATGAIRQRGEDREVSRSVTTTFDIAAKAEMDVPSDAREIIEAQLAGRPSNVFVPEAGFQRLFNGYDLTGWSGDAAFWSVVDGAIVGRTTRDKPTRGNTFVIAKQAGDESDRDLVVDDFELRLSYRITPNNDTGFANSGIQYRSVARGNFVVAGYQADFEAGKTYSGILYDEAGGAGGRGIMAARGEAVAWAADGTKRVTGSVGSSEEIQANIKQDDWNEYVIIAHGNRLQHFINGKQTIDVIDDADGKRLSSGILALQLHAGEPMTVAFKNIRIKSLSSPENTAASNTTVAAGFRLEQLYVVPKEREGSWVATCIDDKGRMIVSDQNGKLYRFELPQPGQVVRIEPQPIDLQIGGAHGLLYAFDSLYVMVNEGSLTHGLYRVTDTNGDDDFDDVRLLKAINGGGEHGLHAVIPSPDGQSLYVVCGNQTRYFDMDASLVPLHWGEDELLPRLETGFMAGVRAPGGFIARTDPDGKTWELIAHGFRNEFDIAFNRDGELFTFDADMEWDIGDPWYRPTRVNHVISGAEFGWRSGAGKWPDYYFDSFGAVVNVGPGSPTGVSFGYGSKFPAKYQNALYISDWSFGKLYAVHLTPDGGSYAGELEEFVTGQPFPITDVIVNPHDGAMYMTVGGRGTQSALYRVTYTGTESTTPSNNPAASIGLQVRRKLEGFHGRAVAGSVDEIWPNLAHEDRAIRFAARVALEWQDPTLWRQRALDERDPRTAIAAIAALARVTSKDQIHRDPNDPPVAREVQEQMLMTLDRVGWNALADADKVDLLRALTVVFTRTGKPAESVRREVVARCEPLFPTQSRELNHLLANLLVYLDAPTAAEKLVRAMQQGLTQEEQIDYALSLRVLKNGWTMELREAYFRWFVETASNYRGGNTFASSLRTMRENAIATLTEEERNGLQTLLDQVPESKSPAEMLAQRKFVKEWTLNELVPIVVEGLKGGRDFEQGRRVYGAVACASCHRFNQDGGLAGPELTGVAGRFSVRDLLESVVEPSKVISDQYAAIRIVTKQGRIVTGRIGNLSGDSFSVVENMLNPGDMTGVRRQDIETIEPSKVSVMPAGLLNTLEQEEILDLVAYLLSRGDTRHRFFEPR